MKFNNLQGILLVSYVSLANLDSDILMQVVLAILEHLCMDICHQPDHIVFEILVGQRDCVYEFLLFHLLIGYLRQDLNLALLNLKPIKLLV